MTPGRRDDATRRRRERQSEGGKIKLKISTEKEPKSSFISCWKVRKYVIEITALS